MQDVIQMQFTKEELAAFCAAISLAVSLADPKENISVELTAAAMGTTLELFMHDNGRIGKTLLHKSLRVARELIDEKLGLEIDEIEFRHRIGWPDELEMSETLTDGETQFQVRKYLPLDAAGDDMFSLWTVEPVPSVGVRYEMVSEVVDATGMNAILAARKINIDTDA